jgi:hypothetical protein
VKRPNHISQEYRECKSIIIKAYQLTADHYRYRFRTSEKKSDEDFVQWGNRTRRYLNRWMAVAEATGDAEKILEQFLMEKLLAAMSPELKAWLKEQKPKTAEELGSLANLHVQSRKGPLIEGKYVSYKAQRFRDRKGLDDKTPQTEQKPIDQKFLQNSDSTKPFSTPVGRFTKDSKPVVRCYKCGKEGHMSFNCGRPRGRASEGHLLCMTPLTSDQSEFPGCNVKGKIGGKTAEMVIDSGCTRTLVHKRYLNPKSLTGKDMHDGSRSVDRIVVPESCRNEILRVGHAIPLSGHMGGEKTFNRISTNFFWPELRLDVRKYCATCPQCQMTTRKMKSSRAPLKPVEIVTEPFKKIAIAL